MKIVSCGPVIQDYPYVPNFAIADDGTKVEFKGSLSNPGIVTVQPFDLSEDMWFLMSEDGTAELFARAESTRWLAQKTEALVNYASTIKGDPLKALSMLRAAAALVGLSIPDLLTKARMITNPNETLADALEKLKSI